VVAMEVIDALAGPFQAFAQRLATPAAASSRAKAHFDAIRDCLAADLALRGLTLSGSFGHGTDVRSFSDIDYLAELPRERLPTDSDHCLSVVADVLRAGLSAVEVRPDPPGVSVHFGSADGDRLEVIPARRLSATVRGPRGTLTYEIPDGRGGWRITSPDLHKVYVSDPDEFLAYRLKTLIRLIKAWKYLYDVPITSIYLELRIASLFKGAYFMPPGDMWKGGTKIIQVLEERDAHAWQNRPQSPPPYSVSIHAVLAELRRLKLRSMRDPVGVGGTVSALQHRNDKEPALVQLEQALTGARAALILEEMGSLPAAMSVWQVFFRGQFTAEAPEYEAPDDEAPVAADVSLSPEVEALVGELVAIGRSPGYFERDQSDELQRDQRVVEIGRRLEGKGGWRLMHAAAERVREELGDVPARELEFAWDGIGLWRA
jgi:hypothetical protein